MPILRFVLMAPLVVVWTVGTTWLLTLAFFGWVSSVLYISGVPFMGSPLLGAFVAGMCFVNVPRSHQIWVTQLKRIIRWLIRIFFAATVGFAVPVKEMKEFESIWKVGPAAAMRPMPPPPYRLAALT